MQLTLASPYPGKRLLFDGLVTTNILRDGSCAITLDLPIWEGGHTKVLTLVNIQHTKVTFPIARGRGMEKHMLLILLTTPRKLVNEPPFDYLGETLAYKSCTKNNLSVNITMLASWYIFANMDACTSVN